RCTVCAASAESATICKQQRVVACSGLIFLLERLFALRCSVRPAPFLFNDFKQPARSLPQPAASPSFGALVFSLIFTSATRSFTSPQYYRSSALDLLNQQRSASSRPPRARIPAHPTSRRAPPCPRGSTGRADPGSSGFRPDADRASLPAGRAPVSPPRPR